MSKITVQSINNSITSFGEQGNIVIKKTGKNYQVSRLLPNKEWYVYDCKTIEEANRCVNCIVFDLPVEGIKLRGEK